MRAPRLAAALLAACTLLASCGQVNEGPEPSPILWEITGEDGRHGYLFGTIHALPDGVEWRTDAFDAAFDRSDALLVEADLLGSETPVSEVFGRLATSPGLPPLELRVSPEAREALRKVMADKGIDASQFAQVESWAAALTIAQAYQVGDAENGADLALLRDAGARRVVELEGVERQLGLFDALPEEEQADLLEAVIGEISGHDPQARSGELRTAWLTGDAAAFIALARSGMLADPELREALLVGRNREWARRIEAELAAGARPFVAVGAAHVIGEDGLAAMLERRGYTLTRIQ